MPKQLVRCSVLALVAALAACGGDGGSTPDVEDAGPHQGSDGALPASDARVPPDTGVAARDASEPQDSASPGDGGVLDCAAPDDGVLPKDLRCTGLYSDFDAKTVTSGLLEYTPAYTLWSDGAEKRRWASIPAGMKIDVSDPGNFMFPVGTTFWKEFQVTGTDGIERLVETRLIKKTDGGWVYTSYVWNEAQTEATQMVNATGALNVLGTGHDVPKRDDCNECHGGRSDFVLGWDALMLGAGAAGVTREMLESMQLVTPTGKLALKIPGNAVEVAALGYLHANCGISCHNPNPDAKGGDSGLFLKLEADELTSVSTTAAFKTGINKAPSLNAKLDGLPTITGSYVGIRPGDPTRSLVVARQKIRGFTSQMPRIATNQVDDAGVGVVTAWIKSMTVDGGYPKPVP